MINIFFGNVFIYSIVVLGLNVYVIIFNGVAILIDNGVIFMIINIGFVSFIVVLGVIVVVGDLGNGLYIFIDGGSSFINLIMADGLVINVVNSVVVVGGVIYLVLGDEIDFLIFNIILGGVDIIIDNGMIIIYKIMADGLGSFDVFGIQVFGIIVYVVMRGGLFILIDGGSSFINYIMLNMIGFGVNYV